MANRNWLIGMALAAFGAAPAGAASFDCTSARAPDEVAICATPALSELDATLGALWFAYSRVPMMMGSNGSRHDDRQAFLRTRATCGSNAICLGNAYRRRITALKASLDAAMIDVYRQENPDPCPTLSGKSGI